jgi:hypothetical protein
MTEPLNLNRARKARARDEARRKADANAVKFGRSKSEKSLDAARQALADRQLTGHRRDDEDGA